MVGTAHVYQIYIAATPEEVWRGITDSEWTKRYFHGTSFKTLLETGSSLPGPEVESAVSATPEGDWHRRQGVEANNSVYELLDRDRTPDEDEDMLRRAYAAGYHWQRATGATSENEARASYVIARALVATGQAARGLVSARPRAALWTPRHPPRGEGVTWSPIDEPGMAGRAASTHPEERAVTSENPLRESSASSTPDDWDREFLLLLRLRGIDGVRIGEALAEVEAHCARSGHTPREAFGDPVGYASSLRVLSPRTTPWTKTVILPVLVLVVGVNLALGALLKWTDGVAITLGLIASLVVFVVFVAMLITWLSTVLRSRAAYVAWFGAGFALMVVPPLFFRHPLITVHPLIALSLGLLFVGLGLLAVRQIPPDPIVDPLKP